jgi:hypothetical protein
MLKHLTRPTTSIGRNGQNITNVHSIERRRLPIFLIYFYHLKEEGVDLLFGTDKICGSIQPLFVLEFWLPGGQAKNQIGPKFGMRAQLTYGYTCTIGLYHKGHTRLKLLQYQFIQRSNEQ